MDPLDRLLRRLVQNIRSGFPEYLTRTFEVAELYQVIVPYRLNRRELDLETNQDYELAVTQLLAGERGYLVGDADMQEALRRELASPNPDTGAFRRFATARVALSPEILRRLETRSGDTRPPADAALSQASPPPSQPGGEAATEPRTRPTADGARGAGDLSPPVDPTAQTQPAAVAAKSAPPAPSAAPRVLRPFTVAGAPQPAPAATAPSTAQDTMSASSRPTKTIAGGGPCRYCGGELPEGRRITFCPHCGQNLTIIHCPACSTELEVGWRFCTTCGREQTGAEALAGR
jgi:hypothetical protein